MNAVGPHRKKSLATRCARGRDRVGGDATGFVVVDAGTVVRAGCAVEDEPVRVRERREKSVGLGGEGVLVAVAGAVHPPDVDACVAAALSACSIASTGVTPTPALTSATGRDDVRRSSRTNRPRGAATSIRSPTSISSRTTRPAAPRGSTFTLMRYRSPSGGPLSE